MTNEEVEKLYGGLFSDHVSADIKAKFDRSVADLWADYYKDESGWKSGGVPAGMEKYLPEAAKPPVPVKYPVHDVVYDYVTAELELYKWLSKPPGLPVSAPKPAAYTLADILDAWPDELTVKEGAPPAPKIHTSSDKPKVKPVVPTPAPKAKPSRPFGESSRKLIV